MKSEKRNRYLYLLLTAGLAAVSILFLLRTFFLQDYYFLSKGIMSDLVRANLPTYYQLYDNIAAGGSFWTWHIGIGASMFTHADVVMDPFTYLVFLRGREYIPDLFIWIPICKTICAAIAAYLYLSWFKFDWRVCVLCANLYAISGIQIFSNNFALGTVCVYCPLYLLGIEHLLDKKGWHLAMFGLLATCLYSYYFFYVSGLLCAIYLVVRLLMRGTRGIRQFIVPVLTLAAMGAVCAGLSAFILLPQVELASSSVRTTSGKDVTLSWDLLRFDAKNFFTAISRLFQLNLLGDNVNQQYVGKYHDYFQFTTYITAAAVPLMTQFWVSVNRKVRKSFVLIVLLCTVCVSIPLFSFAMNSFSTINYRWMFIINLLLALGCALGVQAVVDHRGFYRVPLYLSILATLELVIASTYWLQSLSGENVFEHKLAWLSVILVLGVMVLLDLYLSKGLNKKLPFIVIPCGLFAVMLFEADTNYRSWYNDEPHMWGYHTTENIYDGTDAQVVQSIMAEDTGFYRIQKNFDPVVDKNGIESFNDAMAQGYYGLKSYCSLNNPEYIRFISGMDLACYYNTDLQTNFEAQIFRFQRLDNGKYLILNREGQALSLTPPQAEAVFETVSADDPNQQWEVRTRADVSGAVSISSAENGRNLMDSIRRSDQEAVDGESRTLVLSLMGLATLNGDPLTGGEIRDGYYKISLGEDNKLLLTCSPDGTVSWESAAKQPTELTGDTFNYTQGVYDHYDLMGYLGVKYFISQEKLDTLPDYFSLVREEAGYCVYLNNACYPLAFTTHQTVSETEFMTLYGFGKEAVLLNATVVEGADTTDDMEIQDAVTLAETMQQNFSLQSFTADRVEFDLWVPADAEYLNLSMPYDKDWHIIIDGEKADTQRINLGLLGAKLQDGQKGRTIHVCMEYRPRTFYMGGIVSGATCLLFLFWGLSRRKTGKSLGHFLIKVHSFQ